jgi:hypothetical protein
MLGRTTKAADELATLAERLDAVYRSTSAELPDNRHYWKVLTLNHINITFAMRVNMW